jgi:hypothetical protein
MKQLFSLIVLVWLLTACGSYAPPTEYAPNGEIVAQALLLQIQQTENRLAQELNLPEPQLSVSKIKIKTIEPIYVANLAAYHLSGTYNLKMKQSHKTIQQQNNAFELFLQRQVEGKTWRLLRKNVVDKDRENQWSSYLIRPVENFK